MKVYEIKCSVDEYRYFLTDSEHEDSYRFDGSRKPNGWRVPDCFIYEPLLLKGNFASYLLGSGAFAIDDRAMAVFDNYQIPISEAFPFTVDGDMFYLWNVINCVNVLDHERSSISRVGLNPNNFIIKRFAFHRHRMSDESVFKIPEVPNKIFTYTGLKDSCDEFKSIVEEEGLQGLSFIEVWSE